MSACCNTLLLVSTILLFNRVKASCLVHRGMSETLENGEVRAFCLYQNLRIEEGCGFKDTESCMECYCGGRYMSCCGYGRAVGTAHIEGCHAVYSGCDVMFVRDDDDRLQCFNNRPVQDIYRNSNMER